VSAVGENSKGFWWVIGIPLVLYAVLTSSGSNTPTSLPQPTGTPPSPETGPIFVNITNTNPKVEKAIVHVVETDETDTFDQGLLSLTACTNGQYISVWAPGYYILTFPCVDGLTGPYNVQLEPINATDNSGYQWIDAGPNSTQPRNCAGCHSGTLPGLDEYHEWDKDGHSKVFVSPYFGTTYMGTNINGQQSQQIQWSILGDGQKIYPILDPMKPDYGAGYHLDYPVSNGNCAFCHVPASFPGTLQEMNISTLISSSLGKHVNAVTEGVTCDVCHKVTDVLVGKDQLPYDDRPGLLSMSIVRPVSDEIFAYGPLGYQSTLGANAKSTCYPVFSESKFCAACHYGKFANVEIYGSYKEWLDSSYSKKYVDSVSGTENSNYRSCQDCHMLYNQQIEGTFPSQRSACSDTNLEFRNFSHNMMNYGTDPDNPSREIPLLVKDAAQITLEPRLEAGQIKIKATVHNTGAGHKFPTDSPLRHLILLIEARDWRNNLLTQTGGPMVPVWAAPDYGGYAGEIYANILKDKDTNLAPTFAYWNPAETAWQGADTRLVPGVPAQSEYSFAAPYDRSARITAKLIYRKAFINVAYKKGWPLANLDVKVTEVVMECTGFGAVPENIECHVVQP